MEKVLFLSNKLFVNPKTKNGGVKICTQEFIDLLRITFEVEIFPVEYNLSIEYRIKQKIKLNIYNDYKARQYETSLKTTIEKSNVKYVFLNLSNTIVFAPLLKKINCNIKIILCSHGNETGDLLHDVVRQNKQQSFIRSLFSGYAIGALLKKEAFYRINYIDLVLAISDVEEYIEKWIGAKNTFMVPRIIDDEALSLKYVLNRVGFFGDLSHGPNYIGVESLCNELQKLNNSIEFRLIGGPSIAGNELAKKYPFITYLGYLSEDDLKKEVATWTYFLNLVFYYSRGVSTKLAKAIGFGLPVISTPQGNRGYVWENGEIETVRSAKEMAEFIIANSSDSLKIENAQKEMKKIILSAPTLQKTMNLLFAKLKEI